MAPSTRFRTSTRRSSKPAERPDRQLGVASGQEDPRRDAEGQRAQEELDMGGDPLYPKGRKAPIHPATADRLVRMSITADPEQHHSRAQHGRDHHVQPIVHPSRMPAPAPAVDSAERQLGMADCLGTKQRLSGAKNRRNSSDQGRVRVDGVARAVED